MAKGGRRQGAGRKPGTANVRTRDIADKAAAEGMTPLEYLLNLMRKPYPEDADPATLAAYDAMKMDAAKAAAPYIHPRLANVDKPAGIGPLTGELSQQGCAVIEAMAAGTITPSQASTIMQAISAQARIIEVDELEQRITAIEQAQAGRQ